MDYIPSNILQFDQALGHDGELLQISCVPCLEHNIRENHVRPLPLSTGHSDKKEGPHHHDHLTSHRQINFGQPKRKASFTFDEIDDNQNPKESKKVKKIMHRDIERQRRQEMATLYASLRSHLPLEYLKGKRSISDHVHQAANYIKHLQKIIEKLHDKRDKLKKSSNISGTCSTVVENSHECPSIMGDSVILVRPALIGVEVVVNTPLNQGLPLSRVIDILVEEGLSIVSSASAKINQRLIYALQSEVSDEGSIDIHELQHRLKNCTSEPGFK